MVDGNSEGPPEAVTVGPVDNVGVPDSMIVGRTLGASVSARVGTIFGTLDDTIVGTTEGESDDTTLCEGARVGTTEGVSDLTIEGALSSKMADGKRDGELDGALDPAGLHQRKKVISCENRKAMKQNAKRMAV